MGEELIAEAMNRHTTDNISCVCVCLGRAAPPIGDWHLEGMKKKKDGTPGPLIADPDINVHLCEKDDEFVLLASDGLWDVFSSQGAVTFARERLREHNDPDKCTEELIAEAMNRPRGTRACLGPCHRAQSTISRRPSLTWRRKTCSRTLRSLASASAE